MKGYLPWDSVVIHSLVFSSILILIFLFKLLLCPPLNYWWSLSFHQWPLLLVLWTFLQFSSAQSLSRVRLFAIPWTAARQACLFITNSQSPPKPMSIESVMPSDHLILCGPLLLPPSTFSSIRVFSNESVLHVRCIGVQHQSSQWIFRTDFFSIDWLDLLAGQGTLKSLLQHHSSKASMLWCSAFSIKTISPTLISIHDYWKNHSLD